MELVDKASHRPGHVGAFDDYLKWIAETINTGRLSDITDPDDIEAIVRTLNKSKFRKAVTRHTAQEGLEIVFNKFASRAASEMVEEQAELVVKKSGRTVVNWAMQRLRKNGPWIVRTGSKALVALGVADVVLNDLVSTAQGGEISWRDVARPTIAIGTVTVRQEFTSWTTWDSTFPFVPTGTACGWKDAEVVSYTVPSPEEYFVTTRDEARKLMGKVILVGEVYNPRHTPAATCRNESKRYHERARVSKKSTLGNVYKPNVHSFQETPACCTLVSTSTSGN